MAKQGGKHRAEDQPDGKSTSERMTGKRDVASESKHRPEKTGVTQVINVAGSDLPPRGKGL